MKHVPLPKCLHCGELIGPDDLTSGHFGGRMHRECVIRMIAGSVGHQNRTCACYGGDGNGDPPGMTTREAARAAADLFMSRQADA